MPDATRASRNLTDAYSQIRALGARLDKARDGGGDRVRDDAAAALRRVLDQHLGMSNTTTTTTRRERGR